MTALEDWLASIAPDARVTGVTYDLIEILRAVIPCDICGKPAEIIQDFDDRAGFGFARTATVTAETSDESYDSPMTLGDEPLTVCLCCHGELDEMVEKKGE